MIASQKESTWFTIGVYVLSALLFCAILLPFCYFIGNDGAYYARVGENIFKGYGIVYNPGDPYTYHPVFFPFLIGFTNLLIKNLEFFPKQEA